MENWNIFKVLLSEFYPIPGVQRIPEPDLVMDNKQNALSFSQGGELNTPLGMSYLIYLLQICQFINPSNKVLDLGCGPGTLLTLLAFLMPENHFTGIDLSKEMLVIAQKNIEENNLQNVDLQLGDMTKIENIKDKSFDSIISTIAIHHLPDTKHLIDFFCNVKRILKPNGQLIIADYGRLKTSYAMEFFAFKYKDQQTETLTIDLLNSLKAAFSISEIRNALQQANLTDYKIRSTFISPFMITIEKNPGDHQLNEKQITFFHETITKLNPILYSDFNKLILFMKMGGHKIFVPKLKNG